MEEKCEYILSQLLGMLMYSVLDDKLEEQVKQLWGSLSDLEKEGVLDLLYYSFERDTLTSTYIFSILLQILKEKRMLYYIEENLLKGDMPVADACVILWAYRCILFNHKVLSDELSEEQRLAEFQRYQSVYRRQVSLIKGLVGELEYIPYQERNAKRILLMIEPLLMERHAPSKVLLSMYYYFNRLGYEVQIIATNYKELCRSCQRGWYDAPIMESNLNQSGVFYSDYMGMKVKGYHIMYNNASFIDNIKDGLQFVREYNPLFVLSIGEANLLADLCDDVTTVVTRGTTIDPPCTTVSYILDTNSGKGKAAEFYDKCLHENQKLFRIPFRFEEKIGDAPVTKVTRKEYHIPENCFLIILCGNRLEDEVTEHVCEILEEIIALSKEIVVAFIGRCPKLKKKLDTKEYAGQMRFLGSVSHFEEVIGLANLCLNPPRNGGGTSAYYCLNQEVPVITLPEGDVADVVGEHFCVETLEDMPLSVKRYLTDRAYMEEQKRHCREGASGRSQINNLDNVRLLCDNLLREMSVC